jgi:acetolactate synthase-1/3 small subunit
VIDFIGQPIIERELLLVRIDTAKSNRRDIIDIVDLFKGRVVSVAQKSLTIELAGHSDALEDFISMIKPFGIREIVRSGAIAIAKAKH